MYNRTYILFVALIVISCNREEKFEVTGTISNAKGEMVFLEEVVLNENEVIDSARLKSSGSFKLIGRTDHAGFYQVRVNKKIINMVIEPGERVTIESDFNELPLRYEIDGSDGSVLVQKLNMKMHETKTRLDSIELVYKNLAENNPDSPLLDSLSVIYEQVIDSQKRHNIVFILNFYDNLASLYALYQQLDDQSYLFNKNRDIQYYKILTDSLTKYHPNSPQVRALQNNTKDLLASLNRQRALKLIEGVDPSVPEIALPNTSRDTVRLSDLKGKVVLLSFWASWHAESVNENLRLLDIYKKYHDKGFEIYQVSLDKSYENWIQAVRFNEIPWINVSDLSYPDSYTAKIYNVQQLPTDFLLNDKQDNILGRNLTIAELDRKLNVMLN